MNRIPRLVLPLHSAALWMGLKGNRAVTIHVRHYMNLTIPQVLTGLARRSSDLLFATKTLNSKTGWTLLREGCLPIGSSKTP